MHRLRWSSCLLALALLLAVASTVPAQEPKRAVEPRHDPRRDYAAFLALPAEQQERIRSLVKDLGQEEQETQARLLQVMQRYVTWLERLPSPDKNYVESAPTQLERLGRIRELREKQWLATLNRADRERLDRVQKRKEQDQARQITLWAASRLVQIGAAPGVAALPLPMLEERHRFVAGIKLREQRIELERQLVLAQGPERQEAMLREANRLRSAFKDKDKSLTREDRQFVNQPFPPDDMIAYVRGLVELARKYDVPLPEPRRQPLFVQGFPPLPRDKLIEFLKEQFSESVQRDYEERLREPKKRPIAIAELTVLYWNTHPQELFEQRRFERDKKMRDVRPGKKN